MAGMTPRAFLLFLLVACLSAGSAQAGLSLNPLTWFSGTDSSDNSGYIQAKQLMEEEARVRLEKGRDKYERGHKMSAKRIFKKIAEKYPLTLAAGEARYLHASIEMENGRFARAHKRLQEIIFNNPDFPDFEAVIGAQFQCATALMEGAPSSYLSYPASANTAKRLNNSSMLSQMPPTATTPPSRS
jgi:outer membrane protein assembly factor BamD